MPIRWLPFWQIMPSQHHCPLSSPPSPPQSSSEQSALTPFAAAPKIWLAVTSSIVVGPDTTIVISPTLSFWPTRMWPVFVGSTWIVVPSGIATGLAGPSTAAAGEFGIPATPYRVLKRIPGSRSLLLRLTSGAWTPQSVRSSVQATAVLLGHCYDSVGGSGTRGAIRALARSDCPGFRPQGQRSWRHLPYCRQH